MLKMFLFIFLTLPASIVRMVYALLLLLTKYSVVFLGASLYYNYQYWFMVIPKPETIVKLVTIQLDGIEWFECQMAIKQLAESLAISIICIIFIAILARFYLRPHKVVEGPFFAPEKMVPGSVFIAEQMPAFQAKVFGIVDRSAVKSGQGFRVGDLFITAKHVVENFNELLLVSSDGEIRIPASRFEAREGDVATLRLSSDEIGKIKLQSAKLIDNEISDDSGLFCKVTGFGQSSLGHLNTHPAFGFLKYNGSTCGGFSGAPYYVNGRVYGMHLGGCSDNIGYASAYLAMLIRAGQEDTTDFIFDQMQRYGDYKYEQSPYDPDEYRLRINGKYYLLDVSQIADLLERQEGDVVYHNESAAPVQPPTVEVPENFSTTTTVEELVPQLKTLLGDVTPIISGNAKAPVAANATGAPGPSCVRPAAVPPRAPLRRETTSSTQKTSASNGLKAIRARRDEVLRTTSRFSKTLKGLQPTLQTRLSNKQLTKPEVSSELGELISRLRTIETNLLGIGSIKALNASTDSHQSA